MQRRLTLSVASRVMLVRNLDVSFGLVSGVLGFVNDIEQDGFDRIIRIQMFFENLDTSADTQCLLRLWRAIR